MIVSKMHRRSAESLKKDSKTEKSIKERSKDRTRYAFDLAFYLLAFYAFYQSAVMSLISAAILTAVYHMTSWYEMDAYAFYLDSFIDYLNQVNSGLSSGLSFETSVMQSGEEMQTSGGNYMRFVLRQNANAIALGLNGDVLFDELYKWYPIDECKLYCEMLKLSKSTGASMNHITETTLSNLYTRFRTVSEAKLIVYQKKLEQQILCIAPLLIIFFIHYTSGSFLSILYETSIGFWIMSISFLLLLIMKTVGRKIVSTIR